MRHFGTDNRSENEGLVIPTAARNVIDPNGINGRNGGTGSAANVRARGVELVLTAQPAKGWRVYGSIGTNDATITSGLSHSIFYNDQFNVSGGNVKVKQPDGTLVDLLVPSVRTNATSPRIPLTVAMLLQDPTSGYRANLDPASGRITNAAALFLTTPGVGTVQWQRKIRQGYTTIGAAISTKLEQAVVPLLGTSVIGALLVNSSNGPKLRGLGIVLVTLGIVLSSFFAIAPEITERLVEVVRGRMGRGKKTLAELRDAVTVQLKKLRDEGRPVLVIVDDIDRLSQEEIRLVFQLVKANADFPNLVYLLLFQKDIVVSALSKVAADRGDGYLKKVVQVEFDVPQAPRARMLQIFQADLNRIFERNHSKMYWDKDRVHGLFEEHLWPYFRTLRDVKRFIGTFDFYFSGHVNAGVLEVNPVDLLAVEVLRTFDHGAFVIIRDSLGFGRREDFVRALMGDEERTKQVTTVIASLTARPDLSGDEKARLGVILRSLFPDDKIEAKHEHDLRICHPKHFHKYFEHALDESPTSAANVEAMIQLVADRPAFAARLREIIKSGALDDILEKLGIYFEGIPVEAAPSFVTALFDVGDDFPAERPGFFQDDPLRTASRLIYFLLNRIPDPEVRLQILRNGFNGTAGTVLPVFTLAFIEPDKTDRPELILLDEARLVPLRELAVTKIVVFAQQEGIWRSRQFARLLNCWRRWAGVAPVRAWLDTELNTPARRLDFIGRYVGEATSGSEVVSYSFPAKFLEAVIDLEATAAVVAKVATENPREQVAIALLTAALKRKQAGESYESIEQDVDRRRPHPPLHSLQPPWMKPRTSEANQRTQKDRQWARLSADFWNRPIIVRFSPLFVRNL